MKKDFYEILGISKGADAAEIKKDIIGKERMIRASLNKS